MSVNPYKRELQVARNLVTLRWASIPLIFAFCYYTFNYNFSSILQSRLEPIYIICCVLAVFNIYLTLHISMLSHQLSVTKGQMTLKRTLLRVISQFLGSFKTHGLIKTFLSIPSVITKVISVIYLMVLETVKDFSFNPMSLDNVMHFQVFFDIVAVIFLTRFTGSTESPLFFISVIPITIAGSVISAKAGVIYSVLACGFWLINSLLVKYGIINHLKFFSPDYGDLHQCNIWIGSYAIVGVIVLIASTLISQKLTLDYKEKVTDMEKALKHNKSLGLSLRHAAKIQNTPWISIDNNGKIVNLNNSSSLFIEEEEAKDKNIFDCLPDLKEHDFEYVISKVIESKSLITQNSISLHLKDNKEHIYDITTSFYREYDNSKRLLILFQEKTIVIEQKSLLDNLNEENLQARNKIDNFSKENRELKLTLENLKKDYSDKSNEIKRLSNEVADITVKSCEQVKKIDELTNKVAFTKSYNEKLKAELKNKQIMLEDISDFINSCSEIDELVAKLEKRTKNLFGLENSCFHIFDATDRLNQKNEILDMNKVSPRLLDIPRKHPETLDPALTEGRPVVFSAEFRPENSSTSLAITNGNLKRLIAFVPLKEDNQILGMMMLEKYGSSENEENIVNMVSFYLKHASGAIKNAIANQKINYKNKELHENILKLQKRIDSVKSMLLKDFSKEHKPFGSMLYEISKVVPLKDAMITNIESNGNTKCLIRLDRSKECKVNDLENKLLQQIKNNYNNKIEFKTEESGYSILVYPLVDRKRLIGTLFLYLNENIENIDSITINFCVNILREEYIIYILNSEREIWESFYGGGMSA